MPPSGVGRNRVRGLWAARMGSGHRGLRLFVKPHSGLCRRRNQRGSGALGNAPRTPARSGRSFAVRCYRPRVVVGAQGHPHVVCARRPRWTGRLGEARPFGGGPARSFASAVSLWAATSCVVMARCRLRARRKPPRSASTVVRAGTSVYSPCRHAVLSAGPPGSTVMTWFGLRGLAPGAVTGIRAMIGCSRSLDRV